MYKRSGIGISGRVILRAYDECGELIFEDISENLVVNTGLSHIANQLSTPTEDKMEYVAVGTDNTAPAAGDTALGSESARVGTDSVTQSTNKVTYVATFGPGVGTGPLREAGIFNAASNGIMFARYTYVYDKGASDTLVISWEVTYSAA